MLSILPIVGPIGWLLKIVFGALVFVPIVGPFFGLLALVI